MVCRNVSRCVTLSVSCLVMVRIISFEVVQLARMIANKAVRIYRIIVVIDKIDKTLCICNLDGNSFVCTFAV